MSGRGFEVASAFVALMIEDEEFAAQVTEKIEQACEQGGDAGGEALVAKLEEAAAEGGEAIVTPLIEAATEGGVEAGDALAEGYTAGMERVVEATADAETQVRELLAQNTEEADAAAQAIMDTMSSTVEAAKSEAASLDEILGQGAAVINGRVEELNDEIKALTKAGVDASSEQIQALQAQVDILGARWKELTDAEFGTDAGAAGLREVGAAAGEAAVEVAELNEVLDLLTVAVANGSMSQAEAWRAIAGGEEEARSAAQSYSGTVTALIGTWAAAAAGLEDYGTAEASAAAAAAILADAQDELLGQNTSLMQMYQLVSDGAEREARDYAEQAKAIADAQAAVTAATEAQVTAQNELNLAVIRNDSLLADGRVALMDEDSALTDLVIAARGMGIAEDELALALETGNTETLAAAAATAQAELQSVALDEAQQRLTATQLTLVSAMTQVYEGAEISEEKLAAMRAQVTAAQAEVTKLTAAEKETESAMGGMGMMQMAGWMAMSYIPQAIGELEKLGGTGDHTAIGVNNAEAAMVGLNSTAPELAGNLDQVGQSMAWMSNVFGGKAVQGLQDLDQALAQLYQTDPVMAAAKVAQLTAGMEAQGTSADQVKNYLAAYNAQVQTAQIQLAAEQKAIDDIVPGTQAYSVAVETATVQIAQQTKQTQINNEATAEYANKELAAMSSTRYMIDAVAAQGATMLISAKNTEIQNLATEGYSASVAQAEMATTAFDAAMGASYASMQLQAQTASITSVGLLNLGQDQDALNQKLVAAETSYAEAQQGANAYGAAVTAMAGDEGATLNAFAGATIAIDTFTTGVKTNGDSLNVNTVAGAKNVQAATAIATAAQAAAVQTYQNQVATQGATKAWNDANMVLAGEEQQFIAAADKAGLNKQAVQSLADQLFQLPPNITTNVTVNTAQATSAINSLLTQMMVLEAEGASVDQQEVSIIKQTVGHKAAGGPVQAGMPYLVGEHGPELVVPQQSATVVPADQTARMLGSGAPGGQTINFYGSQYPTGEQIAVLKRELISAAGPVVG